MSAEPAYEYQATPDRPITRLFAELARDTTTLVRKEVELAKVEMSQKVSQATSGIAVLATGGLIAFAGFLFLLLAATYGLSRVVEPWLAALIVGGVVLLIGLILVMSGRSRLRAEKLRPERTIETLKEDRRWAKAQMSR